jgi:hypothetical protein
MKNLVLFAVFFLMNFSVSAQKTVVSVAENNFVFKGVANDLIIMAEGVPCNEITALPDLGVLSSFGSECKAVLKIPAQTSKNQVEIRLVRQDKIIARHILELRELPKPKAVLGSGRNRFGGIFTKDELAALDGLELLSEYPKFEYEITDFMFVVNNESYGSESGLFTEEQQAKIEKLEAGDRIIFQKIKAEGPDGLTYNLNDIVVKIKQ